MSWVLLALAAPLVFTIVNFIDKLLVSKEIRDIHAMPIYIGMMAFLSGVLLFVVAGAPTLPLKVMLVIMATGALATVSAAIYYHAMAQEEATKVVILLQLHPLHVLVLSLVFLNEVIAPAQLLGFVLILGAALAMSTKRGEIGLRLSRPFFLMLLSTFIAALSLVIFKSLVREVDFWTLLPYESWGLALGAILLYLLLPTKRQAFHRSWAVISRRAIGFIALNETLFLTSKVLTLLAVSLGETALVSVLGSTGVFFGLVYGIVATLLWPHIFNEDLSRRALLWKGALSLVMFVGILLVTVR